ncbi:homeobox-leucine zipper protein HAT9 isoform X2 [Arachis ipaensis]|nr:homeobox-leucine zipper protein HAT9 isoform X2 [Arachis ipaensis]
MNKLFRFLVNKEINNVTPQTLHHSIIINSATTALICIHSCITLNSFPNSHNMMMAFSNNNDQELGLGLGLSLVHGENCRQKKKEEEEGPCSNIKAYPSLTLGPEQDSRSSQSAGVSSFSNSSSSIKRERDEEFLLDLDEEENKKNGNPRKKLRLTKQQSALLEDSFIHHSTLNPQKQELAKKLNLRARQVEVWFQNRRARTKLKQTEAECEILKKWCERLREENKRLQKELQHLKSMKTNNK